MPTPTDVTSLKRFLGVVNYHAKFLSHLFSVSEPLRGLEVKDAEWCWLPVHDEAVEKIKSDAPVLKFYDVTQAVKVERWSASYLCLEGTHSCRKLLRSN